MRSRYAAYAMGKVAYVAATQTDPTDREAVKRFCAMSRFTGLEIREVEPGEPAFVTFRAHLEQGGQDASFTERSRFERRDGRWVYVDGERISRSA